MPDGLARRTRLARIIGPLLSLLLLGACEGLLGADTPLPSPGFKPGVTLLKPTNGSSVALDDRVPIDAIAEDASGVLRVDFLVNGSVADSQTLFVAARRYEYSSTWRPRAPGQTTLSVLAYNVNNVASDPVSVSVNVTGQASTATEAPGTLTQTPFVIRVTATPPPSPRPVTPAVTVITTTPLPTQTRPPSVIPVYTVAPTATISQSATATSTTQ